MLAENKFFFQFDINFLLLLLQRNETRKKIFRRHSWNETFVVVGYIEQHILRMIFFFFDDDLFWSSKWFDSINTVKWELSGNRNRTNFENSNRTIRKAEFLDQKLTIKFFFQISFIFIPKNKNKCFKKKKNFPWPLQKEKKRTKTICQKFSIHSFCIHFLYHFIHAFDKLCLPNETHVLEKYSNCEKHIFFIWFFFTIWCLYDSLSFFFFVWFAEFPRKKGQRLFHYIPFHEFMNCDRWWCIT